MKRVWVFCSVLCVLLSCSSVRAQGAANGEGRTVIVASENALQRVFSNLRENQIIEMEAGTIVLTQMLVIDVPGVILRGRGINATVLKCSGDVDHALYIRSGSAQVESCTFHGCRRNSSVVAEDGRHTSQRRSATASVVFDRVSFTRNGNAADGSSINGGAVFVTDSQCHRGGCMPVNLTFRDCSFLRNKARTGGAIFAESAAVTIQASHFRSNTATESGGAIYLRKGQNRPSLVIESSHFILNSASKESLLRRRRNAVSQDANGGAIYLDDPERITIHSTAFSNNTACLGGGALQIDVSGADGVGSAPSFNLQIQNSGFEGNRAYCDEVEELELSPFIQRRYSGGAIHYHSTGSLTLDWMIESSHFAHNGGKLGGALQIISSDSTESIHLIRNCTFDQNFALEGGGTLKVHNAHVWVEASQIRGGGAVYGGGIFASNEAKITLGPGTDDSDLPLKLEDNRAVMGGAIFVAARSGLDMEGGELRNNVAFRVGGAIRVFDTMEPIICRGVLFENNSAVLGGAVAILAAAEVNFTSHESQPTIFKDNVAAVGGGCYFEDGHFIRLQFTVHEARFTGNVAQKLNGREIKRLIDLTDLPDFLNGRDFRLSNARDKDGPSNDEELQYLTYVGAGHGGGLCFALEGVRRFTVTEIIFRNVNLTRNTASVGGGMSVYMSDQFQNSTNTDSCFPTIVGVRICQRFILENVTVTNNRADYAGGLFLTDPGKVLARCNADSTNGTGATVTKLVMQQLTQDGKLSTERSRNCLYIGENQDNDVGSNAASLAIEGITDPSHELEKVASNENLEARYQNMSDSECTGPPNVLVKDVFNQTISTGVADSNLTLILESDFITGDVRYTAVNGNATINNTRARGIGENSRTLTIYHLHNRNVKVEVNFSTRACQLGEFKDTDTSCKACPSEQYGIDPERRQCEQCDAHAECEGGVAMVPKREYWHSTPFSPQFHKCIHPEACEFEDRTVGLNEYYDNVTRVAQDLAALDAYIDANKTNEDLLPDFSSAYPQCAEGYEGVLCGSCVDGYGHSTSGECLKCESRKSNRVLFITISTIWTFLLIGANCLITLHSMRTRVQLVKLELRKQALGRPRRLERARPIRGNISIHSVRTRNPSVHAPSTVESEEQMSITLSQELVTTVQLTETIKLLVNYLQVTGAALSLRVEWVPLLHRFLAAESALVGLASEAFSVPYECHFSKEDDVPASVSAIWLKMYSPAIVMTAFLLILSIYWLYRHWTTHRAGVHARDRFTTRHLITCAIVIFIVTVYFSYIDTVRALLRTVNCIDVDEEHDSSNDAYPYQKYALHTEEKFWAEDTDLKCFQGDHQATGIAGAIGLVLACSIIVFIIVWLPLNKKKATSPEFVARYWFIYQAYRKTWYTLPWEAVILTRKAMIAAVVVFSVHTGPNLQAAMCVGILVINYMVHLTLQPFKVPKDHQNVPEYASFFLKGFHRRDLAPRWIRFNNALSLNELEAASLFSSILVFYSVIIFNDDKTKEAGKIMIAIFTFFVAFSFSVYMFYRLYCGMHILMDLKLETANPGFIVAFRNGLGPIALIRKARQLLRETYWTPKTQTIYVRDEHILEEEDEVGSDQAT